MNKNIRNMLPEDILELPTLSLEDTFEFNCKACGKCCKQRHDIILTPFDLFRIATFFGRTNKEIVDRYCEVYIGDTSHLPIVRLLPVPPDNACPFLRGKKCAVHEKKPVVCRVFPLARMNVAEEDTPRYFYSGSDCRHEPKTFTVQEWIGDIALEEAEEAGRLWMDVITVLFPMMEKVQNLSEKTRNMVNSAVFVGLYLAYDNDIPFISQFRKNFESINNLLESGLAYEDV